MNDKETRIVKFKKWMEGNPVFGTIIILGTTIISLSAFIKAVIYIISIFYTIDYINIDGGWATEIVANNQFSNYQEFYNFEVSGDILIGECIRKFNFKQKPFVVTHEILDGTYRNNQIKFYIELKDYLVSSQNPPTAWKLYYKGTVSMNQIRFSLFKDKIGLSPNNVLVVYRE